MSHFGFREELYSMVPQDRYGRPFEPSPLLLGYLWPGRTVLRSRLYFGKRPDERGMRWFDYAIYFKERSATGAKVVYSNMATHGHFAVDRTQAVFNAHGHVIVPKSADNVYALVATLSTSVACFWLKQVSHNKGDSTDSRGARVTGDPAFDTYEFNGTKLQEMPLPLSPPTGRGETIDALAKNLESWTPTVALQAFVSPALREADATAEAQREAPLADSVGMGGAPRSLGTSGASLGAELNRASSEWHHLRARMVFEQEELDWHAYSLYALLDEPLTYTGDLNTLTLGERAFEIALARKVAAGEEETAWFTRHNSTPLTDLPTHWPADYRDLVERRLELIESNPHINLLERPEYKRRWATVPWEKQKEEALREAALDRLEREDLWSDPRGARTLSIAQLADRTRDDEILRAILTELTGTPDHDPVTVLTALLKEEAVPFLAAYRFKDTGMRKFREWQKVWDLQRREDAGEQVTIPVPPKYAPADFRVGWRHRGKLDVPKERFIAYPGVVRGGDTTPVLGWAGWNHADQALALARAVADVKAAGGTDGTLRPLLAGLAELEPWLHQWHADPDPRIGSSPAAAITGMLDHELQLLGATRPDLDAWRPTAPTRGRKPRKA